MYLKYINNFVDIKLLAFIQLINSSVKLFKSFSIFYIFITLFNYCLQHLFKHEYNFTETYVLKLFYGDEFYKLISNIRNYYKKL